MIAPLALIAALSSSTPAFAAVDKGFVCPESLPDEQSRITALHDFLDAVTHAAPDKSLPEVLTYRRSLLKSHDCAQTLKSLDAADRAVAKGDVQDQAWLPLDSGHTDLNLSISTSYLKIYLDPARPGRAVETYARIDLATPGQTDLTRTSYDQMVAHIVFYCRTNTYALRQADYFLTGKPVRQEKSAAAAATPIPPHSLYAVAAAMICGATHGHTPD
jgi:hypothetical protein